MNEFPEAVRIKAIERIEEDAWESLCRAAPEGLARELGLEAHYLGEALITICSRIDQGQFNRLLGLGMGSPDEAAVIAEAAARFRAAGVRNPFIQIPPGHPKLEDAARAAGLVARNRPWVKFCHSGNMAPMTASNLEIEPVAGADALLFGNVIAAGFAMPPPLATWLAGLVGRRGWRCYLARDAGKAIGGAALYLDGTAAWLGAGAVLPEARRRGAQSALLARRIADAAHAETTLITTETGRPLPGEDHPSFRNIVRAGFTIAYERANWTLPV